MGKFIELHRFPLAGGDAYPMLLNLDDVSGFVPGDNETIVSLRRVPNAMDMSVFRVAESYDAISAMLTKYIGVYKCEEG